MDKKIKHLGILAVFVLLLSACQPEIPTITPPAVDEEFIYGQNAIVDSVEVILLESFPLQAQARVLGNFPDGCTELYEISVERQGQEFLLTLTTRRPGGDVACTEALVPFEEIVDLDVAGLEAGTYTVIAQDKEASFTLDVDNTLPEEIEEADYQFGSAATVEAMQVIIMESDPIQVRVELVGYLPDGCTKINKVNAVRDGQVFNIEIVTRRPGGDALCTMQIVPFEKTVKLDVKGLPAGDYTVRYKDLSESFTLQ